MKSNAVSVSGGIWSGVARGKAIAIWLSAGVLSLEKVKSYVTYFLALSARLPSARLSPKNPVNRALSHLTPRKALPNVLRSVSTKKALVVENNPDMLEVL